jgi:hypothetical protein
MVVKLCPDQIKQHWDLINQVFDVSFPESAMRTKTALLRDLTLDVANCWFYYDGNPEEVKAVFITRLNDDYTVGRKTLTIIASQALTHGGDEMFLECFSVVKKFAQGKDCEFIDFYTDNPAILKYASLFNIFWQSTYTQIKLSDN